MTKYLLLRDNKQSGPYDLDELRTKGLKAYDLVWIDGKSAAWRYPSEVDELKSFAPAVEEQPFDRFYKRPAQSPQVAEVSSSRPALPGNDLVFGSASTLSTLNSSAPAPTIGEPSAVPGKRIIYVTLPSPASRESDHRIPASTGLIAVQQADRTSSLSRGSSFQPHSPSQAQPPLPPQGPEQPLSQPLVQPPQATQPVSLQYQPVPAPERVHSSFRLTEENISHDQGDMWRTSVEMPPRPAKTSLKKAMQSVIVLLCILALLAAGIFIGLSMNRDSFGFSPKFAAKDPSVPGPPIQHADHPSSSMPVYTASVPITRDSSARAETAGNPSVTRRLNSMTALPAGQTPRGDGTQTPATRKKTISSKEKSSVSIQQVTAVVPDKDSAASGFPALHREAVHRTDAGAVDKDLVKNNIANLVSAGAGKYTVGPFGGISEVQITVSNRSIYPLDLVVVEVRYVQANKKVFKTENLYFRGISAGAALMQEAPKSSRGIKIEYKITLINSKELGLSYSGI